ncbi:unnamed protein product [Nezara viridula]|uniref:Cytochrome P450 n=1 Tax=Nezara viridula TaxID=85310 RepID=A0A9P0EI39_NEZVI|nr:unnamed protein product [Nezara viridula]
MLIEAIIILVATLCASYYWLFGFWNRRNVFNVKFQITFLTFIKVLIKNEHLGNIFADIYKKYKSHGMVGFYILFDPMLLVTNPKLVEEVIVKEFNKFHDTPTEMKKGINPLFALNPFAAKGTEKWKELRSIQASNMTTFRFKEILPIIYCVAENMVNYLTEMKMEPIAAKELSFLFSVESSCLCGFGVQPNAFTDSENSFIEYSENIFKPSPFTMFCHFLLPWIGNLLKLRILSKDAEESFILFVKTIFEYRSRSNVTKNDFIYYLMKLNQKLKEGNKPEYSNVELAGHCLTYYLDSTQTTSNQLAFFLLDLANHQHVQDKLRKEISSISNSPRDFDLEKVNSIRYLNMAINESLRMHTQGTWISRTCTQDAVIGNTPIPKGTKVFVPVEAFHNDPEWFPSPEKFDPERFSEERKDSIPKYTFLPFGEGPRICVGYKLALLQIRMAVIFLVLNFTILPSSKVDREEIVLENALLPTPGHNAKLKFKPMKCIDQ